MNGPTERGTQCCLSQEWKTPCGPCRANVDSCECRA
jgi:hypothetical protein